jgi:hypothetical protein
LGAERVLVDRADLAAKRLQISAQIPSPDYFLRRGYDDPFGRARGVEISGSADDSLKAFSGVVIEPPQKLYDDNLHSIALRPFLAAFQTERGVFRLLLRRRNVRIR